MVRDHLVDIQSHGDDRETPLNEVGVSDLVYPITVLDREKEKQVATARITMSVGLPHTEKGTHMSRFIELLNAHRGEVTLRTLPTVVEEMKRKLAAESAHIEVSFTYFLERAAPVSGAKGLMDYECRFAASTDHKGDDFVLGVKVPVTSLCPCSKAISDYGAHNQRGYIDIQVRTRRSSDGVPELVWIEELVSVAEASASAPVYPLLKREDERHVTMQAYDNPVFVEDMVRNVAVALRADPRVVWFEVRADNHESIHNHSAYAKTSWSRPQA